MKVKHADRHASNLDISTARRNHAETQQDASPASLLQGAGGLGRRLQLLAKPSALVRSSCHGCHVGTTAQHAAETAVQAKSISSAFRAVNRGEAALADGPQSHGFFLEALLAEAVSKAWQFDAQGAANMVRAMSNLQLMRAAFLAASAQLAASKLEAGECQGQSVANILWSFATASHKASPLLAVFGQIYTTQKD